MPVLLTKEEMELVIALNEQPITVKYEDFNLNIGKYADSLYSVACKIYLNPRYIEIRNIPGLTAIQQHELLIKELKQFNNYQEN
jgi:hypothetical protein